MKFSTIWALAGALLALAACAPKQQTNTESADSQPIKVIFETDMGNDIDDAMALGMLFKYADEGKVELIGISSNKRDDGSVEYIDALTTWAGRPEIPIGRVENGVPCDDAVNYALLAVQMTDSLGAPLFPQSHANDGHIRPATEMYRQVLAEQPDSSVTVISVGFSTNLAQLLSNPADKELIAKKVKNLVMMGGDFENNNPADSLTRFCEYNIIKDIEAARTLFRQWPTPIVTSPFEVGIDILYPGEAMVRVSDNPIAEAYKVYLPMPYDRPTWDLTAVLYAIEGTGDYFTISPKGTITVEPKGGTLFTEGSGNHQYLTTDSLQKATIQHRLTELLP